MDPAQQKAWDAVYDPLRGRFSKRPNLSLDKGLWSSGISALHCGTIWRVFRAVDWWVWERCCDYLKRTNGLEERKHLGFITSVKDFNLGEHGWLKADLLLRRRASYSHCWFLARSHSRWQPLQMPWYPSWFCSDFLRDHKNYDTGNHAGRGSYRSLKVGNNHPIWRKSL